MPRVSLAMPVYNGENFIEEALDSILAQDFADFELIITDNASVDSTEAICRRYAAQDERIIYHRHPRNLGAAPNYNSGYEIASGDYLKWCAHDDFISRNYLGACVRILDDNPDVALAFGRTQCVDERGEEIRNAGFEIPPLDRLSPSQRFGKVIRFSGTCFAIFGLFRMDVLKRTSLHRLYYGSDRALLAETALLGKFGRAHEAVFYNREHRSRSINIDDKRVRLKWQFADSSGKASFEHWSLLAHLLEIARKHPDVAPSRETLFEALRFAATPGQLSRYALELIGAVSPSTQRWIRKTGLALTKAS